ncbi:acyl carrier protein [Nonomuraea jabiensis]|uniref:acyl carrier protein n=1 Tax=Nonomuraea jabiensis TaxID=882448 RepID=UPI00342EB343
MTVTEQKILDGLQRIIEEVTGIPATNVTPESSFVDDLDIDSLSMVEVALAAQEEFGVEIPDERLKELRTVKDAVAFIQG